MKCVQFRPSYTEIYLKRDIRKYTYIILYYYFILIYTYYMYVHSCYRQHFFVKYTVCESIKY